MYRQLLIVCVTKVTRFILIPPTRVLQFIPWVERQVFLTNAFGSEAYCYSYASLLFLPNLIFRLKFPVLFLSKWNNFDEISGYLIFTGFCIDDLQETIFFKH